MEGWSEVDGGGPGPHFQAPPAPPGNIGGAGPPASQMWHAPLPASDRTPARSGWTTAALIVLGLALLGLVVGLAATVALVARPTPKGHTEEAWAEFFVGLLTILWVAGGFVLALPLAVVGVVTSARRGGVRPIALVALVASGVPVAAGVGLWAWAAIS